MIIKRGEDPGPFQQPRDYVAQLRTLFRCRCAYCLVPDDRLGGKEAMEVDHFIPESREPELRLSWKNLYYCCKVCNNRKSDKPKPSALQAGKRFVDPCVEDPDHHFRLVIDHSTGDFCKVEGLSLFGTYEIEELEFNRRDFLRGFWRELNSRERLAVSRRAHVLALSSQLGENDEDAVWLLNQCDLELAQLAAFWPFPRN